MIRVIDATTVLKAGAAAKTKNGLWRIHSAFDLPSERFGHFELTDEHGGERLDRIPVIKNEIRLADRAYMQPDQIAPLLEAGADIVVRAGWKNARWLDANGAAVDIIETFKKAAECGVIDQPIWIGRKSGPALAMRLVAIRKSPEAAQAARNKAKREAQKGRHNITESTLIAAEWVILVTSLPTEKFSTEDIFALYRLRWRIELAFKRSLDDSSARAAHRRTRGLSPLGSRRLTRPGAWRLTKMLAAIFLQAIMTQPSFARLRQAKIELKRNLHEPPRKRRNYQRMVRLF
jgi:hypothetical protein